MAGMAGVMANESEWDAPPTPVGASAEHHRPLADVRLGRVALLCALWSWCGVTLVLIADLGWIPRAIMLGGFTLLVSAICWLAAVGGGLTAAIAWRSRAGCLALPICLLLPVAVLFLVSLVGSGWKD
jgi:hypothetical protein